MYRRLFLAGLALFTIGVATASAQGAKGDGGARWNVIATGDVDLGKGSETLDMSSVRGAVRAIRVRLVSGTAKLSSVKIDYAPPAKSWTEKRVIALKAGGTGSDPIDRGTPRVVSSLTLSFTPQPGDKATFEILGLQSPADEKGSPAATGPAPVADAKPAAAGPTSAAPGSLMPNGAIYFGHESVTSVRDRDTIRVPSELGQFEQIKLRVLDVDVFVEELRVVYTDGQSARLPVNVDVKRNSETPWLKLPKADRFIERVDFAYRTKATAKTPARVEAYGQLSEGWLGKNGRARQYNEGWVLLGAQIAARFLRPETDSIPVGRNEGEFKRLRILVKERDLILNEIRVVYDDNQEEVFTPRTKVTANSTFGPVNLKSDHSIRSIRATWRSVVLDAKAIGRGAAVVEVWGQH